MRIFLASRSPAAESCCIKLRGVRCGYFFGMGCVPILLLMKRLSLTKTQVTLSG